MTWMQPVEFQNYLAVLSAASAFGDVSSPAAISALCDLVTAIIMRHFGMAKQHAEIAVINVNLDLLP